MNNKPIEKLKDGDFFTLKPIEYPKDTQVYIFRGYDRSLKKYFADKFSDISQGKLFKKGTQVYTDFIFNKEVIL